MESSQLLHFVALFTLAKAAAAERISERLALVLRDPAAYQEQFAEELEERGIVATLPMQELRDVALIDALLSEELVWEADWQDPVADLAYGINETLAQQGRVERLNERAFAGRATTGPEALDALQEALEPMSLALVLLTLDSDSHALSVVAETQAEELRGLAKQLGFELAVY